MRGNGSATTYQANQVSTVNKNKLIIMMYDGAIRFIDEAITKIEKNDIPGRGISIGKAQRIIIELENALDKNRGGQVANSLQKSYIEMNKLLTNANIKGEAAPLRVAVRMLQTLKSAWEKVINGFGPGAVATASAATAATGAAANAGKLKEKTTTPQPSVKVAINA